jgi:hypothetical protein
MLQVIMIFLSCIILLGFQGTQDHAPKHHVVCSRCTVGKNEALIDFNVHLWFVVCMNTCACKVRFVQNTNTPDMYEFTSLYVYCDTAGLNLTIVQTEAWTLLVASQKVGLGVNYDKT